MPRGPKVPNDDAGDNRKSCRPLPSATATEGGRRHLGGISMQHVLTRPRAAVRLVPAALAAGAVLGLGALSPASAVECGAPAQPATYQTVDHPAVTETVPARTHLEWQWSRQVAIVAQAVSRTTPGYDVRRWSRTTEAIELEYAEKVVDRAAVAAVAPTEEIGHEETVVLQPEVTVTQWEYQQMTTGNKRWEREGWNAGDKGKGWDATGETRVVVTPAVTTQRWVVDVPASPGSPGSPEVSHLVSHWLAEGTAAPAGWTATGNTRVASSSTETVDLPDGQSPDGSGWVAGDVVDTVADVVDTLWIGADDPVPAGYQPTGETSTSYRTESAGPSAAAPEGDGWSQVADSAVEVVDVPERVVETSPAWSEQVLVTPAVPAGPACENPPPLPPVVDPQPTPDGSGGGVVAPPLPQEPTGQAAPAAPAATASVLPATGSDVSPWVPAAGLASVVLGLVLTRRSRRHG